MGGARSFSLSRLFYGFLYYITVYSAFGYDTSRRHLLDSSQCTIASSLQGTILSISGDDTAIMVDLPFSFPFYCNHYNSIGISTNGLVTMGYSTSQYWNMNIPNTDAPNNYITPFWTDLVTNGNTIYTYTNSESYIILQWTNMGFYGSSVPLGTFQTTLYNNGTIVFSYLSLMGSSMSFGDGATVGIENSDGTKGISISYMTPQLYSGLEYLVIPNGCEYIYSSRTNPHIATIVPNSLPNIPSLTTPTMDGNYYPTMVSFTWVLDDKATYYKLFVATDSNLENMIYQNQRITTNSFTMYNVDLGNYYWKVYSCNSYGCTESCIYHYTIIEGIQPSPPPPEPPSPPPPEPPSPPPPEVIQESFISPQTIETISSTVSATISTAVAASVSSVMSSSIASSVGGSTSIPSASPAGLVSMIGVVQTMNMKMNMQVGGTPETFKGLAGGVGWINLDASFPGVKHRRMLLSESTNPYHSATSLFLYSYIFLLSISIPHYFYQRHKAKKQEKLQGMMHFPQLEFTIILLLINPYTKAAATLFTYDHSSSILAGIGMLLALPIPVLLFSIYIIYKNILEQHYAKFVVFGKIHKVKGFQNFIQRGLISTNKGHWKEEKDQLLDKYGIFFKSVRGPLYVFKDKEVRYDEKHKKYKWGKVRKVEDKLVYIRAFYKPYYILRNICTALLLNAFRYSTTGNVAQLILLILILTTHFYFMMFVSPFNTSKDQFTDLSSNMCELGTYVAGFGLLMARRFDIPFIALQMEKGMFVFQILSVAIQVLTQMWTVVVIAQIIKELFQKKLYYDHMIQEARKKLLLKKYTNRWLYKVHKKTLQGWTPPIGEEPKDRKAIIIYI